MAFLLEDSQTKLDFSSVLIVPRDSTVNSRRDVELRTEIKFRHCPTPFVGVPIIAANMDTIGTFSMAKSLAEVGCITAVHKHYALAEWVEFAEEARAAEAAAAAKKASPAKKASQTKGAAACGARALKAEEAAALRTNHYPVLKYVAVSTGISKADFDRTAAIIKAVPEIHFICIDVANGYSSAFKAAVGEARKRWPSLAIIAGNVVDADRAAQLLEVGADIIKIGIGPGSVCTTRKQTGIGFPQFSAVAETVKGVESTCDGGKRFAIMSDGGCTCPGDVAKAFGAGAQFVMLGGMLAGHDECEGEMSEGQMLFYGMSSAAAMNKHAGGVAEYRSSEGKVVRVPYRGPVRDTVNDLLGGLRSSCTYVGAATLNALPRRARFVKVHHQLNNVFTGRETQ